MQQEEIMAPNPVAAVPGIKNDVARLKAIITIKNLQFLRK